VKTIAQAQAREIREGRVGCYAFPCKHLLRKARSANYRLYTAWGTMRNQVSNLAEAGLPYKAEKTWFHKETGFAQFLLDIGLPPGKGFTLARKGGDDGDFSKDAYYWKPNLVGKGSTSGRMPWQMATRRTTSNSFAACSGTGAGKRPLSRRQLGSFTISLEKWWMPQRIRPCRCA